MDENIIRFIKPLSKDEARKIISELAQKGAVILTGHSRERMTERDISFVQVLNCLMKGVVTEGPSTAKDGQKMTVERIAAGEPLTVVCVLRGDPDVLVVTVY